MMVSRASALLLTLLVAGSGCLDPSSVPDSEPVVEDPITLADLNNTTLSVFDLANENGTSTNPASVVLSMVDFLDPPNDRAVWNGPSGNHVALIPLHTSQYRGNTGYPVEIMLSTAFLKDGQVVEDASGAWAAYRVVYEKDNQIVYSNGDDGVTVGHYQFAFQEPAWSAAISSDAGTTELSGVRGDDPYLILAYQTPPGATISVNAAWETGTRNDIDISYEQGLEYMRDRNPVRVETLSHAEGAWLAYAVDEPVTSTTRLPRTTWNSTMEAETNPVMEPINNVYGFHLDIQTSRSPNLTGWTEVSFYQYNSHRNGTWSYSIESADRSYTDTREIELFPTLSKSPQLLLVGHLVGVTYTSISLESLRGPDIETQNSTMFMALTTNLDITADTGMSVKEHFLAQ